MPKRPLSKQPQSKQPQLHQSKKQSHEKRRNDSQFCNRSDDVSQKKQKSSLILEKLLQSDGETTHNSVSHSFQPKSACDAAKIDDVSVGIGNGKSENASQESLPRSAVAINRDRKQMYFSNFSSCMKDLESAEGLCLQSSLREKARLLFQTRAKFSQRTEHREIQREFIHDNSDICDDLENHDRTHTILQSLSRFSVERDRLICSDNNDQRQMAKNIEFLDYFCSQKWLSHTILSDPRLVEASLQTLENSSKMHAEKRTYSPAVPILSALLQIPSSKAKERRKQAHRAIDRLCLMMDECKIASDAFSITVAVKHIARQGLDVICSSSFSNLLQKVESEKTPAWFRLYLQKTLPHFFSIQVPLQLSLSDEKQDITKISPRKFMATLTESPPQSTGRIFQDNYLRAMAYLDSGAACRSGIAFLLHLPITICLSISATYPKACRKYSKLFIDLLDAEKPIERNVFSLLLLRIVAADTTDYPAISDRNRSCYYTLLRELSNRHTNRQTRLSDTERLAWWLVWDMNRIFDTQVHTSSFDCRAETDNGCDLCEILFTSAERPTAMMEMLEVIRTIDAAVQPTLAGISSFPSNSLRIDHFVFGFHHLVDHLPEMISSNSLAPNERKQFISDVYARMVDSLPTILQTVSKQIIICLKSKSSSIDTKQFASLIACHCVRVIHRRRDIWFWPFITIEVADMLAELFRHSTVTKGHVLVKESIKSILSGCQSQKMNQQLSTQEDNINPVAECYVCKQGKSESLEICVKCKQKLRRDPFFNSYAAVFEEIMNRHK
eukprot:TRINITY_DN8342_c0_g1_i4.p1 TRINITY_DN8342_c0_g1~~TRINITY_DN8342_c0_g1_i4.p1  ORF type:complete len:783 (+),score=126.92 TRINITY_DN8342_c0_g1_i4:57-2405(+)